ncbi:MAG: hypothetical protein ABIH11_09145 [Candidatus Altiarchaeota archaeon]
MSLTLAIAAGGLFLIGFYCLFYLAHLLDWSVRTLSGNKQGLIFDLEPVKNED